MDGASAYIDLAMTWGATYGIGVLLDLQAAPGSQNGCALMLCVTVAKLHWVLLRASASGRIKLSASCRAAQSGHTVWSAPPVTAVGEQ